MFKFEDMKKLILLLGIVIMTISVFGQTQNDSTRYRYDIKFQVKAKPTKTITNKHYKLFVFAFHDVFKKTVVQKPNRVGIVRNLNVMALDSTMAELLNLEYSGVNFFEDLFIEAIIENKTLDTKYHCWYISGKYQNHIVTETYDPYNSNGWTTIQ